MKLCNSFSQDRIVLSPPLAICKELWSKAIKYQLRCDKYAIVTYFKMKNTDFWKLCLPEEQTCVCFISIMRVEMHCSSSLSSAYLLRNSCRLKAQQYQRCVWITMESSLAVTGVLWSQAQTLKNSLNFPSKSASFFVHKDTPLFIVHGYCCFIYSGVLHDFTHCKIRLRSSIFS